MPILSSLPALWGERSPVGMAMPGSRKIFVYYKLILFNNVWNNGFEQYFKGLIYGSCT
jgi:hypothetical protein